MAAISDMLNEALGEYDQNMVLMVGATASVVIVSGLAYCCSGEEEEEEPASPVRASRSKNSDDHSILVEKKKEKSKPKKKSSGAKKQQEQPVQEEKKKTEPSQPPSEQQQNPVSNEDELEFVKPRKGNKKSKKVQKQSEKPIEKTPSSPPRNPSPPPQPKEPSPPVSPKISVEEVKTESTKASKKKGAKTKQVNSAPVVPEPEPIVKEEETTQSTNGKKSKKNKKNKEAANPQNTTKTTTTTIITSVETVSEDAWTTVKTKRSTKSSSSNNSTNNIVDEVMMDVAALEKEMMVDVANLEQEMLEEEVGHKMDLGIFVSTVIGREGKTIKGITEKSGAKLKVGGKNGEDSSLCVITGDDEAIALAVEMIQEILDREQAIKDNNIEVKVEVGDKMPAVIGKKGLIIKKIVSESGATIDRLPNEDVLMLRGFAEQVAAAKALIDLYMAGGPPPEAREEVELGSERGRFIVLGPNGQTIRNMQEETGAKLNLEHNKTFVTVEGDVEAVAAAVSKLRALLDENSACEKVSTKGREGNSHIPAIIGKQGATIRALRDSSGAAIDLLSAEDCVKISGTREQVKKARAAIQKILDVEDTPPYEKLKKGEVCEKFPIPLPAIGMIIGRMGMMIKQIKEESGAEILVPKGASDEVAGVDGGDPTTTAKVWGTPAAVEKAISAIKEVLKKHEERAKNDKKRAAAKPEGSGGTSNGKSPTAKTSSSGGGDGSITFFTAVDDDIMPEDEISFEVGDIKVQNEWDAAAENSAPPGITAAPGWS